VRIREVIVKEGPGALGGGAVLGVGIGGLFALSTGNIELGAALFCLGTFAGTLLLLIRKVERHHEALESTARYDGARVLMPSQELESGTWSQASGPVPPPSGVQVPTRRQSPLLAIAAWAVVACLGALAWLVVANALKDWGVESVLLASAAVFVSAWGLRATTRVILGRRLGIFLGPEALTVRRAGFGFIVNERFAWEAIENVGVEDEALTVNRIALRHEPLVLPAEWVVLRARDFIAWKRGGYRAAGARQVLLALEEKLSAARCMACNGPLLVPVAEQQPPCPYCGCAGALAPELAQGLRGLASLFADLRRANGEIRSSFLRLVLEGDSRARWRIVGPAFQTLVYAVLVLLPLSAAMWLGSGRVFWSIILPPVVGLAAVGLVAWIGWWALVRLGRHHAVPLAAIQVSVEGQARCRCCGAPLDGSGVVRECAHCRGANVVGPATARRALPTVRHAIREALQDAGVAWLAAQREIEHVAQSMGARTVLVGALAAAAGWFAQYRCEPHWYAAGAAACVLLPVSLLSSTRAALKRLSRTLETGDLTPLR
jgi:hypothetical protein